MDQGPPAHVSDQWADLITDAATTADQYRRRGWEAVVLHPETVTPLTDTPYGLDVRIPSGEFNQLGDIVAHATFDSSDVYRTDQHTVRFFVIVVEAPTEEWTVIIPAYLRLDDTDALAAIARDEGRMYTHVHPVPQTGRVTFTHDDPAVFFSGV